MDNARTPLTIFVSMASECLTDHESHGDGLICFSLLNGLAERGHTVYAYTTRNAVRNPHPRLHVRQADPARIPMNSLKSWEHSLGADRYLKELLRTSVPPFDVVWRMHPYGPEGCPLRPFTAGRPLVVGPIPYAWPPDADVVPSRTGRPRLGVGIGPLVARLGALGWRDTLRRAVLATCMTATHARAVAAENPDTMVHVLPVIVEPPIVPQPRAPRPNGELHLVFVANLVANKRPRLFLETIRTLRRDGVAAFGVILGDGTDRAELEAFCARESIAPFVTFRGRVPNTDVYKAVGEADFLVSTSYGEPYGRGIVEAMSVGTPCLTHRSGGPADFIQHEVTGLLSDKLEADVYAGHLKRYANAPQKWRALSDAARTQAANEWSAHVVLSRLESWLYEARDARRQPTRTKTKRNPSTIAQSAVPMESKVSS